MHIDDMQVLNYIKDTLGIGTIHISKTEAYYSVSSRQELNIIIAIFPAPELTFGRAEDSSPRPYRR
jgi:hypothetical protein